MMKHNMKENRPEAESGAHFLMRAVFEKRNSRVETPKGNHRYETKSDCSKSGHNPYKEELYCEAYWSG